MSDPYVKIIGIDTGKLYIEGLKCECLRELGRLFSEYRYFRKNTNVPMIYPEPLKIIRVARV